jgi:hypothetical protein
MPPEDDGPSLEEALAAIMGPTESRVDTLIWALESAGIPVDSAFREQVRAVAQRPDTQEDRAMASITGVEPLPPSVDIEPTAEPRTIRLTGEEVHADIARYFTEAMENLSTPDLHATVDLDTLTDRAYSEASRLQSERFIEGMDRAVQSAVGNTSGGSGYAQDPARFPVGSICTTPTGERLILRGHGWEPYEEPRTSPDDPSAFWEALDED